MAKPSFTKRYLALQVARADSLFIRSRAEDLKLYERAREILGDRV